MPSYLPLQSGYATVVVVTQEDGRQRAREAVIRRLEELGLSQRRMAAEAKISTNTIARFLGGGGWPRSHQVAAMEEALRWPVGSLTAIADGADPLSISRTPDPVSRTAADGERAVSVRRPDEAGQVVVVLGKWSENLTALEREAYEAEVRAFALKLAVELEEKSRTRRDEPAAQ